MKKRTLLRPLLRSPQQCCPRLRADGAVGGELACLLEGFDGCERGRSERSVCLAAIKAEATQQDLQRLDGSARTAFREYIQGSRHFIPSRSVLVGVGIPSDMYSVCAPSPGRHWRAKGRSKGPCPRLHSLLYYPHQTKEDSR